MTTALALTCVDADGERGLLGIAFDPDYLQGASSRWVYLYYTRLSPSSGACSIPGSVGSRNRVVRFKGVRRRSLRGTAPPRGADSERRDQSQRRHAALRARQDAVRVDGRQRHRFRHQPARAGPFGSAREDLAHSANRLGAERQPVCRPGPEATRDLGVGVAQPVSLLDRRVDGHPVDRRRRRKQLGGDRPRREGSGLRLAMLRGQRFARHLHATCRESDVTRLGLRALLGPVTALLRVHRHRRSGLSQRELPASYEGRLFFGDYVSDWIRSAKIDPGGTLSDVQLFIPDASNVVDIAQAPNGCLGWVSIGDGSIHETCHTSDQDGDGFLSVADGGRTATTSIRRSTPARPSCATGRTTIAISTSTRPHAPRSAAATAG